MKKSTKIWLITAGVLCVAGAVTSGAVIAVNGFDFTKFNTVKDSEIIESTINDTITSYEVDVDDCSIVVEPSDTGKVEISAPDYCSITPQGDKVVIKQDSETNNLFKHFTVNFGGESVDTVKIKVPYGQYNYSNGLVDGSYDDRYFTLTATSGDVLVKELTFYDLKVTSSSGDIMVNNVRTDGLALTTGSGDIAISMTRSESSSAQIKSSSGDITVDDAEMYDGVQFKSNSGDIKLSQLSGDVDVKTTSGDIEVDGTDAGDLSIYTDSGEINIKNSYCASCKTYSVSGSTSLANSAFSNDVEMTAESGDININIVKAENFYIETTSGDIDADVVANDGSIYVNAKSASGDVDAPKTSTSSEVLFKAISESGDIKVEVFDNTYYI